ncbi:MAG: HlyD family efflux transporter periplasmic adaptor subunit, partial [Bacteroidetes bacterium]|nr:HlyD family efflux transporter periplasmic adaptor subunit [Bacteroidota bacterium]
DQSEYQASLVAARSNFFSLLTSAMPDLLLDYPNEAGKWQTYLKGFDINKTAPVLPSMNSEQEKYYISNKGIINTYYTIKNMEERLSKYHILAPFNGVLTEALVSEGALVRAGQKLGEFIDPSVYELELAINESYKDLLKIGNTVKLYNLDKSKSYTGKVVRVNSVIDASTQSIQAYIELLGKDLNEGMYLAAELQGREEKEVYEISRKLLIDNKAIYAVKDSTLILQEVNPIYFTEETAILKGIPDGTLILNKAVPGAHSGMLVKIANK